MKKLLLSALLALGVTGAHAEDQICFNSVMLAHKAYMQATFDAARPNYTFLHYLVDYYGDGMDVKFVYKTAHAAANYITVRLQPTGLRKPDENVAYEAAREYMVKECMK